MVLCESIIGRSLGERLRWYAYRTPTRFPDELTAAMHRAGCVGLNFGADSGSDSFHRVSKFVMKSGTEWNPSLLFGVRVETARGADIKDGVCGGGRRADGLHSRA